MARLKVRQENNALYQPLVTVFFTFFSAIKLIVSGIVCVYFFCRRERGAWGGQYVSKAFIPIV